MQTYCFQLQPLTAFGSPLHGDALFGQLCWAIRHRLGEDKLSELLQGYDQGQPFMVVSDALPQGYYPRPQLPQESYFSPLDAHESPKTIKKQIWLKHGDFEQPLAQWAKSASALAPGEVHNQPHNSINRTTGTTGEDGFAPYHSPQTWYHHEQTFDIYIVLDENRLSLSLLHNCLQDIGNLGFGRDAGIGLGKFSISPGQATTLPQHPHANAYLTLSACAPQADHWQREQCFYQIMTRFGRHGDHAALSGQPYKNPILLCKTGAVFTPKNFAPRAFIGNGLTGLSKVIKNTVHQGYAPVLGIQLEKRQ